MRSSTRASAGWLGLRPLVFVGNPHNVASREVVTLADGTTVEAIVHRKGATPAHQGVLGFIPGTMADPGFLTRGLGLPAALNSASHGAGRRLGRRQAMEKITRGERDRYLLERGVTLLGGGIDEAPQAYKDIAAVMAAQSEPCAHGRPVHAAYRAHGRRGREAGQSKASRRRVVGAARRRGAPPPGHRTMALTTQCRTCHAARLQGRPCAGAGSV